MDYKPLFDKLLIKPISSEQNVGGIIIPDTSTSLKQGIVIAAGDGRPGEPMSVKVNQKVLFKKDGAEPVTLDGQPFILLSERDIWMIN